MPTDNSPTLQPTYTGERDGRIEWGWNDTYDRPVKYIYAYAHTTLTVGNVYRIVFDAATDVRWETAAAATGNGQLGVATEAATTGTITKLIIEGPAEDVDTTASATIVAGDHLEVLNAVGTVNCDGTSGSTAQSPRSIGIALTAGASDLCDVMMFGLPVVDISAS